MGTESNFRLGINEVALLKRTTPVDDLKGVGIYLYTKEDNKLYKWNGIAESEIGGAGGSAHTIQEEGSSLADRTKLNFIGSNVTVTDNEGSDRTDVTITGGTGAMNDLSDANVDSVADKHVMIYDGVTDNRFENRLLLEADIDDLQSYLLDIISEAINDLSDVTNTVTTNRAALMHNGVGQLVSRLLIEADISDLQTYLLNIASENIGDLSDVTNTVTTNRAALVHNGAGQLVSRLLLALDISDFNAGVQLNQLDSLAAPTDTTLRDATGSLHGLMPKADKTKLDGIEALAEVNPDLISQVEAEAGTATTERIFSALRVKQAIDALGSAGTTDAVKWKEPVRIATTANGTLATAYENGDTLDGVVLATGNRILLKDQIAGAENGIYTVNASGAPTRATDYDGDLEVVGSMILSLEGTANTGLVWRNTNTGTVTIGTTALTYSEFGAGGAGGSDIGCRATKDNSQSIPNDSNTVVTWNTEDYDTDIMHDNSTNNDRITFKTAGKYLVIVGTKYTAAINTSKSLLTIYDDGGAIIASSDTEPVALAGATVSIIKEFAVNDWLQVKVQQNSGSSKTLTNSVCFFTAQKVDAGG